MHLEYSNFNHILFSDSLIFWFSQPFLGWTVNGERWTVEHRVLQHFLNIEKAFSFYVPYVHRGLRTSHLTLFWWNFTQNPNGSTWYAYVMFILIRIGIIIVNIKWENLLNRFPWKFSSLLKLPHIIILLSSWKCHFACSLDCTIQCEIFVRKLTNLILSNLRIHLHLFHDYVHRLHFACIKENKLSMKVSE